MLEGILPICNMLAFAKWAKFVRCNAKNHEIQVQLLFRKLKPKTCSSICHMQNLCRDEKVTGCMQDRAVMEVMIATTKVSSFFPGWEKHNVQVGLVLGKQPLTSHWKELNHGKA